MSCTTRCYWKICSWNIDYLHLHRIPHQLRTMGLSFLLIFEASSFSSRPRWQGWRSPKWSVPLVRLVICWKNLQGMVMFACGMELWNVKDMDQGGNMELLIWRFFADIRTGIASNIHPGSRRPNKEWFFLYYRCNELTKSYYHGAKYRRWTSRHI